MRYLASLPFILLALVIALALAPVVGLLTLALHTVLLIRGAHAAGPHDTAALMTGRRMLVHLTGACWKCDAHVVDPV